MASEDVPPIRDGDLVECVFEGETLEGVAIVDRENSVLDPASGKRLTVLLVELDGAVVLPDPRFPVQLLRSAAGSPTWTEAIADFERRTGRRATDAERDAIRDVLEDRRDGLSAETGPINPQFVKNAARSAS